MTVTSLTKDPEVPPHPTLVPTSEAILAALPHPILVIDSGGRIRYANPAAEPFFDVGATILMRHKLTELLPGDSPLVGLVTQVRRQSAAIRQYGLEVRTPRIGTQSVDAFITPVMDRADHVMLLLQTRGRADQFTRQLTHWGAARSVRGMASILAHEIKNPLASIRGAAQLMDGGSDEDRALSTLIRDEADRIRKLVEELETFSDFRPIEAKPVNIHAVLDHVLQVAETGFASSVRLERVYDPSLPEIAGDRDRLIQAFLNLLQNAVDAAPPGSGEIILATAYRPGLRMAMSGTARRVTLPLEVSVSDNGPGVPEDVRASLFEPFVTTKSGGKGLGLALAAKIIGDHGGVIDVEREDAKTVFRIHFPLNAFADEAQS